MSTLSVYAKIASHDGYCARCDDERPLVVIEHGPRGFRAWLAGIGPEDRELSYACRMCGTCEHVPLTEAEDDEYAATLATWPDWSPAEAAAPIVVAAGDVFALAAARIQATSEVLVAPVLIALPVPRRPIVRVIKLPVARVAATDEQLLAFVA